MLRLSSVLLLAVIIFGACPHALAQVEKTFPTNDEINLVLNQSERALERYKNLLEDQQTQIGQSVTDQVAEGRRISGALAEAIKAIKPRPFAFNGPAGFTLLQTLSAADRNSLRCEVAAASQSAGYMIAGKPDTSDTLLHLSQSCMDLSTLIFTISEQAGSLFKRYVTTEDQQAAQTREEARRCADEMEKMKPRKLPNAY